MRFRHPDGSLVHLAYCSNVHAADDAEGVMAQLHRFAAPLRETLGLSRLGVGLWVSAPALQGLLRDGRRLEAMRADLGRLGLEVVTLNGFPYRGFHEPVVKHAVYSPSWADPQRASYTLDLVRLLGRLLPDDAAEGSISTLPLGWHGHWSADRDVAARRALTQVAEALAKEAAETGKPIRLAVEPEPGCVVETMEEAAGVLAGLDTDWIGVCLDACHLAVQFEEAAAAAELLRDARVPLVKAQVSSALRIERPGLSGARALCESFVEPRFLHQVRERTPRGLHGVDDLESALGGGLPARSEWRVHFHTPVHAGGENTTQPELVRTLGTLVGGAAPLTHHLEVETYTWSVLPPDMRPHDDAGLVAGLASELSWTRRRLTELGLEEIE